MYAPEEEHKEDSEEFYNILQKAIRRKKRITYILGNFNARTGGSKAKMITGPYRESIKNRNGKRLIDFYSFNNYKIMNALLMKKQRKQSQT